MLRWSTRRHNKGFCGVASAMNLTDSIIILIIIIEGKREASIQLALMPLYSQYYSVVTYRAGDQDLPSYHSSTSHYGVTACQGIPTETHGQLARRTFFSLSLSELSNDLWRICCLGIDQASKRICLQTSSRKLLITPSRQVLYRNFRHACFAKVILNYIRWSAR